MTEENRYLVLSDSHGFLGRLEGILMASEQYGPFDAVIHLGDGCRDLDRFREHLPPVIQVYGNCDALYTTPGTDPVRVEELGGVRTVLTHGHTLYVRSGTDGLYNRALRDGAAAVLYGHTHRQKLEYRNGVLIMNPGAVEMGRWALLTVRKGVAEGILK